MNRLFPLAAVVLAVSLDMSSLAFAASGDPDAPVKKKPAATRQVKRHIPHYTTPPGYRTPERIERDRRAEINRSRRAYYRAGGQPIYYWKDPDPRFFRGRWNGGSFGPCWTSTPIGYMWNCGK
jgi:hypothetical protein